MESGWDVKALHRLIVTSATYRQSSDASPTSCSRATPRNALYARGPRWRMTAEMVRDGALARERPARRRSRRAERQAVSARRHLESAEQLLRLSDAREPAGRRSAPAHALHVREAQRDASRDEDLRLHESHREHRAPPQLEHAAAGAAADERPAVRRGVSLARGRRAAVVRPTSARSSRACIDSRRARRRARSTSPCCATTTTSSARRTRGNDAKIASVLDVGVVPADASARSRGARGADERRRARHELTRRLHGALRSTP